MVESQKEPDQREDRPRVEAVVLNWNGGDINFSCLDAVLDCGYPDLGIIFVDNGSSDGSGEAVKKRFPHIEHIFTNENLGFTGGNNRGIRRALERGAEMILILNNDVHVPRAFLDPLVETLQERPGVAGPKILDPEGRIWCAGGSVAFHHNVTRLRGFGRKDDGAFDRAERVDYMPACCLLVSREVFETAGLLNEEYFCYLEDVEFCLRAAKAGFAVTYCPASSVVHRFSHSTGGGYTPARKYMNGLNSVRFLRSHGTLKSWLAFWVLDVLLLPPLLVLRLFQGEARGVLAKGRGILDGLMGRKVTSESLQRFIDPMEGDQ